jgi:uncharacterized protein (TIGR00369 family)
MSDSHYRKLEAMYRRAPINRFYRPEIRIESGSATIEVDVREDFFHAASAAHGSVLWKMLDDACFFAASSLVPDVFVLTVSFTTYFTRPVSKGRMTSTGRVVHAGKNLLLAEAVVTIDGGKEAARGNGSFMKGTTALTPEIGYVE